MKTLLTILLSLVIAIQAYSAPQSPASAQTYKKLTLAEFFAGEIEATPLSIEVMCSPEELLNEDESI